MEEIQLQGLTHDQLLVAAITTMNGLIREQREMRRSIEAISQIQDDEALQCPFNPRKKGQNGQKLKEKVYHLEEATDAIKAEIAETRSYIRGFWKGIVAIGSISLLGTAWQIGPQLLGLLTRP